jgi:hypothetical protein
MTQLFRKSEFWFISGFTYGTYICEDLFNIKGMHDFSVVFFFVAVISLSLKTYFGQEDE